MTIDELKQQIKFGDSSTTEDMLAIVDYFEDRITALNSLNRYSSDMYEKAIKLVQETDPMLISVYRGAMLNLFQMNASTMASVMQDILLSERNRIIERREDGEEWKENMEGPE